MGMIFFSRKRKSDFGNMPQIRKAHALVNDALTIVELCKRDRRYTPSDVELALLDRFENDLWESYCAAQYLSQCLRRRAQSVPEVSNRWHQDETFDFHYYS